MFKNKKNVEPVVNDAYAQEMLTLKELLKDPEVKKAHRRIIIFFGAAFAVQLALAILLGMLEVEAEKNQ